jgi:uncharacterized protein YbjT (DUF2867 family)
MPVLVTGAESGLGRHVVDRLLPLGGEVRAFVDATVATDDDVLALRARGCKVAVGELDDEGHLESAMTQAHTVVHCWGGPLHAPEDQVDVAATLASAVLGAGLRRLIWVRELVGGGPNDYLSAQAEVTDVFEAVPCETVAVATAVRYGDDDRFTARLRRGWLSGSGVDPGAMHAPVHLDDVAGAMALADRARGVPGEAHLRLGLVGPETMVLSEFVRRLGAPALDARRPAGVPPPPGWLVDWLSRDAVGDTGPDGAPSAVARAAGRLGSE